VNKRTKTGISIAGIVTVLAAAAAVWRLRRTTADVGEEPKP